MDWVYVALGVATLGFIIKILKGSESYDDLFAERINTVISETLASSVNVSAQQILNHINHPDQSDLSTEVVEQLARSLIKVTVLFRKNEPSFTCSIEMWLCGSEGETRKVTTEEVVSRDELPDQVRQRFMQIQDDVLLLDWETPFTPQGSE